MKVIFDRRTVVASDRRPFLNLCGTIGAVICLLQYAIIFLVEQSGDWKLVGFIAASAVASYIFFIFIGEIIWALYFKPAIEARNKDKRAA